MESPNNGEENISTIDLMAPSETCRVRNSLSLVNSWAKGAHGNSTNITGYCQDYWLLSIT